LTNQSIDPLNFKETEGSLLCPVDFPTATSYLRPNLILSSHLHLGLGGGFFPSGFMAKHCTHFVSLSCLLHGHFNMDALGLSEELYTLYLSSLGSSSSLHVTAKETFKKKGDLAAISTVNCPHTSAEGQHCSNIFDITQSFVTLLTKAPF
jgi:hypothetical protein